MFVCRMVGFWVCVCNSRSRLHFGPPDLSLPPMHFPKTQIFSALPTTPFSPTLRVLVVSGDARARAPVNRRGMIEMVKKRIVGV